MSGRLRLRWVAVLLGLLAALAGGARVLAAGGSSISGALTFNWSMAERFGMDAVRFVNSPVGRAHNLRGINARVIAGGVVRPGDAIRKLVGR